MKEYQPDPNCRRCKGKGLVWVMVAGEGERDACVCVELIETDESD